MVRFIYVILLCTSLTKYPVVLKHVLCPHVDTFIDAKDRRQRPNDFVFYIIRFSLIAMLSNKSLLVFRLVAVLPLLLPEHYIITKV